MAEAYPNRSDLRNKAKVAKAAATGQAYGKASEQMRAQSVMPVAAPPTETGAATQPVEYARPGTLGAFARPTERPNEPITAGASFGPGATPLQAGTLPRLSTETPVMEQLRAMYIAFPNDDLADLIESYSMEGY